MATIHFPQPLFVFVLQLVAAGLVFHGTALLRAQEPAPDLQGEWIVVEAKMNGKALDVGNRWVIQGKNLFKFGKQKLLSKLTIDTSKNPRTFDEISIDPPLPAGEFNGLGIYQLKGNILQVCLGPPNNRPMRFSDQNQILVTLKRARSELKAQILDHAGLFSEQAIGQANQMNQEIQARHQMGLTVETFANVPAEDVEKVKAMDAKAKVEYFQAWSVSRSKKLDVKGVYVLICVSMRALRVDPSAAAQQKFLSNDGDELVNLLISHFGKQQMDQGLLEAVDFFQSKIAAEKGTNKLRPEAEPKTQIHDNRKVHLVAQLGHSNSIQSVAFSPDGRRILTGGDTTARLWDAATGEEIRTFEGHTGGVNSVTFSWDGKQVLTGSYDKTARLWDIVSGKVIRSFQGHASGVEAVAMSRDGTKVLTGSADNTARLWDAATGKEIHVFRGHKGGVWSEDFSPDGKSVMAHYGKVLSVAFSPDGKYVLTGATDKTARLWDASSGEQIRAFQGHTALIYAVAFSPDGNQVLTGSWDATMRLWNAATGKESRAFRDPNLVIRTVAFSPDGKRVVTGGIDGTARLWDLATGKELKRMQHGGWVTAVFSPNGKQVLTGSWDRTARLWDAASGKEIVQFHGKSSLISAVAFSPDGKLVLTASADNSSKDQPVRLWDAASGKEIRAFQDRTHFVLSAAFSPDGKQVLTGSWDKTARLWDADNAKVIRAFQGHGSSVWSVAFSPDGKKVLTGSDDETARLWDVASGKEIRALKVYSRVGDQKKMLSVGVSVAFSPDGKHVLTGSGDGSARLWDASDGKQIRAFQGHTAAVSTLAFSPDGKHVLTGCGDRAARLWEASSGKFIRAFRHTGSVLAVAFSRDGTQVLTGSSDNRARLWDTLSGNLLQVLEGHNQQVVSVAFSPNGKHLLTGSPDATARLWDARSGRELCRLLSFGDGDWAVVDPEGRYDASNGGDVIGLHWVVELEAIALKQLKKHYYEPGLLAKHMGFSKQPLRPVEALKSVQLAPDIQADAFKDGKLTVKLTNRGAGIGRVQVFVNGKELSADARGSSVKQDPDTKVATVEIDLKDSHYLPGEKNVIRIVPWNKEDGVSGRGFVREWDAPGEKDKRPPELYAIVVGVSEYAEPKLKLRYAAKDAQDFAQALTLAGKRLLEPAGGKVHLTLLCDADGAKAAAPSRANFIKALETIARQAKPNDVLVVYLAGHGVALEKKDDLLYCYLTQEANSTSRSDVADADWRERNSVTSTELTEWFKRIAANKQVLLLDTCAAGAAASKLMEHRDIDAEAVRALDRLQERSGFHVLMGCASDKVSYEATRYGQGLMTYSLLEGMKGAALREGEFVDISKLFQYAADRVPQLAQHIGGIQKPLIMAPRGTSFDVGRLLAKDKALIPLAQDKPVFLRPKMINPDADGDDDLGLEPLLSKRLFAASSYQGRGKGEPPELVYIDAADLPGAIRPVGTYMVQGDKVTVRIALRRDKTTLTTIPVAGQRSDLPGLALRMTAAITTEMKKTR